MENASRALVMAGAILIAVMLISITMYFVSSLRSYSEASAVQSFSTKAEAFNRYFVYSMNSSSTVTGTAAYNLIGKALDINNSIDALTIITIKYAGADLTNYSSQQFETAYKSTLPDNDRTYHYEYKIGEDGLINQIIIN